MMNKAIHLLLILPLLSLSGCLTHPNKEPEWVSNPKIAYPENLFLVALGTGDTRRAAENSAAASLARIFESHIESYEQLHNQFRETTTHFEYTSDFSSDIQIISSQTLFNIQHAEAWKDPLNRYHAVAYLNRRDTAEIYRDKISVETTRVNFLKAELKKSDDLLTTYATLRAANAHAKEAAQLLRQLQVIHLRSVPDATPSYSLNQLRKALADTAKQIKVQIEVDGDEDQRMMATLQAFMTRYGFVIGEPMVLGIQAAVEITDTGERAQGLVFVRYELMLQIKDSNGDVLITVHDQGREAHKTMDQARIRSFRTLENAIKAGGSQRLDTYFDSLTDQP
ncbi:MAG: LPP20 family lipoprotein [Pontiella sp.]